MDSRGLFFMDLRTVYLKGYSGNPGNPNSLQPGLVAQALMYIHPGPGIALSSSAVEDAGDDK